MGLSLTEWGTQRGIRCLNECVSPAAKTLNVTTQVPHQLSIPQWQSL